MLLGSATLAAGIDDPIPVEGGQVVGVESGLTGVRVYRGIPFAAPPAGDLRWKPPQPVVPWDGVRRCAEFGPACPQPSAGLFRTPGRQDEDCLYLNVWTAAASADEKRPVMVWIHGGGSTVGSASQPFYDGRQFAADGVVLVSINYRLGPFGFLAHPELSAESPRSVSGNYGTLDQIAALKWVQQNVARFGGDPGNVTIFGESAGAVSCGVLLVSPLAEGLFHRAILQSGVPVAVRSRLREGDEAGERQGQTVFQNLGVKNVAEARRKSATEVLGAIRAKVGLLDMGAGTKYGPIVDGWVLPDLPMKRLAAGQFHRVPVLAGSNADEATMFSDRVSVRSELGYRLAVRAALGRDADEVLKVFPPDYADSPKATFEKLVTVMSFVSPARMLVRLASRHQPDTYLYHFTRVPAASARLGKGATHGIEIPFVFQWGGLVLAGPKDRELARSMHRCWVQFAHRGDPNGEGLPEWPRYDAATDRHLEFGDEVRVGTQLYQQECDLFERLARREWER